MEPSNNFSFQCPLPEDSNKKIAVAHGGGGKQMHQLIQKYIQPLYSQKHFCHQDSAVLNLEGSRIGFTTDSFVVDPIFFPGADIGKLAICGTINDLAMAGAIPKYISLAFIIEEGFSLSSFERVLNSIAHSAKESKIEIVTGDTKVVGRAKGDKIYINTTGIGHVKENTNINPHRIAAGDMIIVSGDIGRHGVAVMSCRDGTAADVGIESDCQPLDVKVQQLLEQDFDIHCMRDLTRGGLASALNELAELTNLRVALDESKIPITEKVAAYCEILGIEPYYLANEGRFICVLPPSQAIGAMEILGNGAAIIGSFILDKNWGVTLKTDWGTERILPMLSGEQLPRIC